MGLYERVSRLGHGTSPQPKRGLLSRAAALHLPSAGTDAAFEDAFIVRMQRLNAADSAPFTSLSLLKAFQPFSAGLCLALSGGTYECVAAVGVESAPSSIPEELLFPTSMEGAHRIGLAGDFGIASASPETAAWVFPVPQTDTTRRAALILVEETGKPFAVESISRVVAACADRFSLPPAQQEPNSAALKDFLASALRGAPGLHLIVLQRDGDEDLANEASAALSALGSAMEIDHGRALIAVPTGHDRELLAHRLAKSLQAVATAGTEVSNLDDAQDFLDSLA